MPKNSRKLILVRSDLLDEIRKITAREGKTLFSFTNEVFTQVLATYQMNASISDVVEFYRLMQVEKETGVRFVPPGVLEYITEKFYPANKEEMLEQWYESGLWYGKYLSMKFDSREPLEIVEKFMKNCLWNLADFSVLSNDGKVKIRLISPRFSSEHTSALSKFLEGIMCSMNYRASKNDSLKGISLLEFEEETE